MDISIEVSKRRDIRFIDFRGHRYLRAEDILAIMQEFGAAEETDVRNRVIELVGNISLDSEITR